MKIPYSGGPKRLTFQIRKFRNYGSTSLLISNRFEVWSAVRCRHVKKTRLLRFHELKDEIVKFEKGHVLRRQLGVNDERLTLRQRLADFYWETAETKHRAKAIDYFRKVKRNRLLLHFVVYPLIVVYLIVLGYLMVSIRPLWFIISLVIVSITILYRLGVDLWHELSDYIDNVVVLFLDQMRQI